MLHMVDSIQSQSPQLNRRVIGSNPLCMPWCNFYYHTYFYFYCLNETTKIDLKYSQQIHEFYASYSRLLGVWWFLRWQTFFGTTTTFFHWELFLFRINSLDDCEFVQQIHKRLSFGDCNQLLILKLQSSILSLITSEVNSSASSCSKLFTFFSSRLPEVFPIAHLTCHWIRKEKIATGGNSDCIWLNRFFSSEDKEFFSLVLNSRVSMFWTIIDSAS